MPDQHQEPAPPADPIDQDAARVRSEYARRADDPILRRYYRRVGPAMDAARAERLDRIAARIREVVPSGPRVLDIGCGDGGDLSGLVARGFDEKRLAGVDLLERDVARARTQLPDARIEVANAARLPHPDSSFDAVMQLTALSSVTDPTVRFAIASEMVRVTRRGGLVISYDLRHASADNPNLVAIDAEEVHRLFGGLGRLEISSITLAIPIASRVAPFIARLLNKIPILHLHLLAILTVEDHAPGNG